MEDGDIGVKMGENLSEDEQGGVIVVKMGERSL